MAVLSVLVVAFAGLAGYLAYAVWRDDLYDIAANWLSWGGAALLVYVLVDGVLTTGAAFTTHSFSASPLLSAVLATATVCLFTAFLASGVGMFLVPAHERCHQAVARYFGIPARIECKPSWLPLAYTHGWCFSRPAHKMGDLEVWQDRLVCGAPLVLGIAMLPVAWVLIHVAADAAYLWGAVSASILAVSLSGPDWCGVVRFPWGGRSLVSPEPPASHLAAEGIPR